MYPVANNVYTDLLYIESGQCLILGQCTLDKAGVCCMHRGMTITHRHRLHNKDTVFL